MFPTFKKYVPIRVLAISDGENTPSAEICLELPLNYLSSQGKISYEIRGEFNLPEGDFWRWSDVVMILRGATDRVADLALQASNAGKTVIYITDDDIQGLLDDLPANDEIRRHYESINALENIRKMVAISSRVLVYSDLVKDRFSKISRNVEIVSAAADFERIKSLKYSAVIDKSDDELRIGYAASGARQDDLDLLGDALPSLLEKFPNLYLETIDHRIDHIAHHPRYRTFEKVDGLENFYKLLLSRDWDVGIAPLAESRFRRSKTNNKYRTYASAGIPGIYSNRVPYSNTVVNGKCGLLAGDGREEWQQCLERLLLDRHLSRRIAQNAAMDVESRYGLKNVASYYFDVFKGRPRHFLSLYIHRVSNVFLHRSRAKLTN
ncbi:glycosyltransferase [Methylobacterium sp. J-030]|uniref:glycosyltransferase n=1 Tax=Methylobacterium sp. J-030 TaxID=2836627 RepID=UPI001FB910EF|nr:glycosyltransferase [Methylobacterium sp. J-030]MCJ2073102.1 glycosyltransferase [Methylobacterium sp. J-030]